MPEQDLPSEEVLQDYFERQKEAYKQLESDPRGKRMTFALSEWMYQWIRRRAYEWDVTKSQAVYELLQAAIFQWHEENVPLDLSDLVEDEES